MSIFFSSDEHFSHANILKYCNRPFKDAEAMDNEMIRAHNAIVQEGDLVYHLGDFTFKPKNFAFNILRRLNGKHFFIRGNHDAWNHQAIRSELLLEVARENIGSDKLVGVEDYLELKLSGEHLVLFHFPMFTWHKNHRGSIHLHGHCVDMSTDILTVDGWKKRNELAIGTKCYSLNTETGLLEIDTINELVDVPNYSGKVVSFKGKSISLRTTDKHVVLFKNKGVFKKKTAIEFAMRHNRDSLLISGNTENQGIDLTLPEIKLLVLMAADGSVIEERNYCRIRVTKDRKKEYIKSILIANSISFVIHETDESTSFNFNYPSRFDAYQIKGLDQKLMNCNQQQFEAILEAYTFSDGYNNGRGVIVYSAKEKEIDLLQAIAVINGYSAAKHSRKHGFSGKLQHQLSIYKRTKVLTAPKKHFTIDDVAGEDFWCVKTKNQNFIARHNGKVMITGNCHGSIDEINKKMDVKRLDVGVDSAYKLYGEYRPFRLKEVIDLANKRGIDPPDFFENVGPNKEPERG